MTVAPLKLKSLDDSGYVKESEPLPTSTRKIHRYILADTRTAKDIAKAVNALRAVLRENVRLFATFSTKDGMDELVSTHHYLVINEDALCLSKSPKAPNAAPIRIVDNYFTEALIENAVSCTRGHTFEKRFIEYWLQVKGDNCPAGKHPIGDIEVDEEVRQDVAKFEQNEKEKQETDKRMLKRVEESDRQLKLAQLLSMSAKHVIEEHRAQLPPRKVEITGAVVKTVAKIGVHAVVGLKIGEKTILKGACATCKETFKVLPIVGIFVGVGLSIYRFRQGEYVRAGGELASGLLSGLLPGVGTLASLGIDAGMLAYDVYETVGKRIEVTIPIKEAHEGLGLSYDPKRPPTDTEINAAYKKTSIQVHPDKLAGVGGQFTKDQVTQMQQMLTGFRDQLRRYYGYSITDSTAEINMDFDDLGQRDPVPDTQSDGDVDMETSSLDQVRKRDLSSLEKKRREK